MSNHYCPCCGAELPGSLLMGSSEQIECPACNEWISMDVVAPGSTRNREKENSRRDDRYDDVEDAPVSDRLDEWRDGDRLVIHMLPGSNHMVRGFAGCLLVTVGILGFFTWNEIWGNGDQGLTGLAVLGLTWMCVIPTVGGWIFARFGSSSVMLEPDRLVVEHRLFGLRTQSEYRLSLWAKAGLVASHRLSGDLVYGVRVNTAGGQPVFATWFLPDEKRWIARRINRHLRHPDWEQTPIDSNAEITCSMMDGFSWGE